MTWNIHKSYHDKMKISQSEENIETKVSTFLRMMLTGFARSCKRLFPSIRTVIEGRGQEYSPGRIVICADVSVDNLTRTNSSANRSAPHVVFGMFSVSWSSRVLSVSSDAVRLSRPQHCASSWNAWSAASEKRPFSSREMFGHSFSVVLTGFFTSRKWRRSSSACVL